jgi:parallel beta-helix repeat protein
MGDILNISKDTIELPLEQKSRNILLDISENSGLKTPLHEGSMSEPKLPELDFFSKNVESIKSDPVTSVLAKAILATEERLKDFAASEEFYQTIDIAFGSSFSVGQVEDLHQQWITSEFEGVPNIQILTGVELNGALGAFSEATNTIYLSEDFIEQNISNPWAISNVLLEEYGHYVDSKINEWDAAGDEGAIFSDLVRGVSLDDSTLQRLKAEDDSAAISVGGVTVWIEQATYYVSGSGKDTNNGFSTSSAFRTIQKAANLTKPGDTVLIMNGLYTNSHSGNVVSITRSGTSSAWIKYQAYSDHKPKIKHNAWHGIEVKNSASYIEIKGLEIEGNNANISRDYALSQRYNTSNPLTSGNGITVDGRGSSDPRHIKLFNNKIYNCGGGGISVIRSDYVTINGNEIYNNAWYSPYANSGVSMWQNWNSDSNGGYKMYVTNNKIYNNRQYVPWIANGKISDGNGIVIDDSRHTQNNSSLSTYKGRTFIANNIVYKNGGAGIVTYLSERVDIINNTAYMNNQSPELSGGQILAHESSDVKVMNNILYAYPGKKVNNNWNNTNVIYNYNIYFNSSLISVKGANDRVADPKFVNASAGDFRLSSSSPAINNGWTWGSLKLDFAKAPRPSGTKYDIGAYEYQF